MPPLEVWRKVFISDDTFIDSTHGRVGCITCHGGAGGVTDMAAAHANVVVEPDSLEACGPCHADIVASDAHSLHSTLAGFRTTLTARSAPEQMGALGQAWENHCQRCHTSCGQCHVSRPTSLGGGLLAGHEFKPNPPMTLTCTACHGSCINDEYKGLNRSGSPDVHWAQRGMSCSACHPAAEMHGESGDQAPRYAGSPSPGCRDEGCHDQVGPGDGITHHSAAHLAALSCQVCHATEYKNCYGCHVAQHDGTAYFKIEPSVMAFKIGLNPIQSEARPWKYVTLRHAPVTPDTFGFYGEDLLSSLDVLPTWKYATPHNIQRYTPQTMSCDACHGSLGFFLTEDNLMPYEVTANRRLIISQPPPPIGTGD